MSHLENIATRQRKSLVRDALFAAMVAVACVASIATIGRPAAPTNTFVANR